MTRSPSPVPVALTRALIRRCLAAPLSRCAGSPCKIAAFDRARPVMLSAGVERVIGRSIGKPMEIFTPRVLYDLYVALTDDDKKDFLRLIARISTAEMPFLVVNELDIPEQSRFSDLVFEELTWQFFPILLREARRLAREKPEITDDEFDALFHERMKEAQKNYDFGLKARERAVLKSQRDRKSKPETIRRNVEICNLRKQDDAHWSLKRLAKQHKVSVRAITKILSDEARWRRLASDLGTN